ncbi:hypothetical protein [Hallella absiana]|jgi:hypothetical protein|uniref:hypothetical protein n=1 Tax=Hallella absiana TaxID=2925336 RepID=UPI0021C6444F|nr:hypothetical protein [Hallella absiana]
MGKYKTIQELKENNGWAKLKVNNLWDESGNYIFEDDKEIILKYNANHDKKNRRRLIVEVPPEPFWGNPFKADIIILSKNPGYVEHINKWLPTILSPESIREICEEKEKSLRLESDCLMSSIGVKLLSDMYWVNSLKELLSTYQKELNTEDEQGFYKHFALVQLNGYTSEEYPDSFAKYNNRDKFLPSQEFTKNVLELAKDQPQKPLFVVMRGKDKWKELIGDSLPQERTIVNPHPINQYLTQKNLGDDNYDKILTQLKLK